MRCPACDHENIQGEDLCQNCSMDLAGLDVAAAGVSPEDPVLLRKLGELPLKDPLTLPPEASVAQAMELMRRQDEGCVFVLDERERPSGVFTERDLLVRVAGPGRDPRKTRLSEVMTREPAALCREDPMTWALHRMGVDGYRHLPVLDGQRLCGFLSMRTILRALLRK